LQLIESVAVTGKSIRTISLIAMPGAGKSTAGRHLANALHLPFVDADHELERRIGMSIRSFFELEGEVAFRDLEEQVIADLAGGEPKVLATGGGAVLRPANRKALHQHTTVIYLRATPDELFRRLRHDTQRPLLQVADPLKKPVRRPRPAVPRDGAFLDRYRAAVRGHHGQHDPDAAGAGRCRLGPAGAYLALITRAQRRRCEWGRRGAGCRMRLKAGR
jgi:shikimate kinase